MKSALLISCAIALLVLIGVFAATLDKKATITKVSFSDTVVRVDASASKIIGDAWSSSDGSILMIFGFILMIASVPLTTIIQNKKASGEGSQRNNFSWGLVALLGLILFGLPIISRYTGSRYSINVCAKDVNSYNNINDIFPVPQGFKFEEEFCK